MNYDLEAARLKKDWAENPRWRGIKRGYTAEDVVRLRGSIHIEHTLARRGAEKLWRLINDEPFVNSLGAMTGNQAMQQVKAGLKAIYLSGWQVAADANIAGEMYPDQSLYPANSVPHVVRRINNALMRADQIQHMEGKRRRRLVRADRGGRRGRLRRRPQRLRAHEGDDRGRGRRRALRGPARVGEEVRPHGRQGARADARSGPEARRRAAGRRLHGRADDPDRAHRCRGGRPRHLGRRRQRQAVPDRRAHGRGLLQVAQRPRPGDLARPGLRAVRRPDLVRDRQARPRVREGTSPRRSTRSSRARCWRTTARRRSTGRRTSTTRPSPSSSASWARWATSSSSSRWPASTASTTRMFDLAYGYARNQMSAFVELQEAEFAAAEKGFTAVTPPARGRHRLLRRGHDDRAGQQRVDDCALALHRGRAVLRQEQGRRLAGPKVRDSLSCRKPRPPPGAAFFMRSAAT